MISVLEMFKIGIGPSSSHTLAPMKAGKIFVDKLIQKGELKNTTHIKVDLYGSLSLTGKGHQTDQAIILGLAGEQPDTVEIEGIPKFIKNLITTKQLALAKGLHTIKFDCDQDIIFNKERLPLHENGMTIQAFNDNTNFFNETYYSVGGGVIVNENDFGKKAASTHVFPHPFNSAQEILNLCNDSGLSISAMVMENELSLHSREEVTAYCQKIWQTMQNCMDAGMKKEGVLPGPMRLHRRAPNLRRRLTGLKDRQDPLQAVDWVNMYALAVSEENAAGGRVVTAPTNGACGIIPAVLAYYNRFVQPLTDEDLLRFFLSSGAIGLLYRMNASISGAEVGCQGEVGVACSMAAAGLAELLGASPQQACTAAEIGMEHNLGLTCDPIGGQVQIPCIERNAINAIKAINSARMAMERVSNPSVSLDKVIEAMFHTGKDMNAKYRETSLGGLANVGIVGCS